MSCYMLPKEAREFFLTLLATNIREWIMWSDAPEANKAVAYSDVDRALACKGKNGLPPSSEFKAALRRLLSAGTRGTRDKYKNDTGGARELYDIQAAAACGVIDGGEGAKDFVFTAELFSANFRPNPWTATKYLAKMAALPVSTWKDVILRRYN